MNTSDYRPPYEITDNILNLVSSITEKTEKIALSDKLQTYPHLHRQNRIRSIHSSLKIEANSLALTDVENVINGQMVSGPEKDILEVKNAYEAYEQIETVNPYSVEDLLKIHGIMVKDTVNDSGPFRHAGEGVFSGNKCIFVAPPATMVPTLIKQLLDWIDSSNGKIHPLVTAAVFHYEFVFIHPFTDGNGRMARLWHTILLSKWKNLFKYVPIESRIERNQAEYYNAINESNKAGNSTKFIEFSLQMIDDSLDELILQYPYTDVTVSEYVNRLLIVMSEGVPYTTARLMNLLNLKSRETFRKNYMGPAIKKGLVVMEIPDKPNSRNQRYIRIHQ